MAPDSFIWFDVELSIRSTRIVCTSDWYKSMLYHLE